MALFPSMESLPSTGDLNITMTTIQYGPEVFLNKLQSGELLGHQIEAEISNNWWVYVDYDQFADPEHRLIFQRLWTNKKFLNGLRNIVLANPQHSVMQISKTTICTICHDYYNSGNIDLETRDLLIDITANLNRAIINSFLVHMDVETAKFLALLRYSSFDIKTTVERVNRLLVYCGYDFSIDTMVFIYERLFPFNLNALFNFTMCQVIKCNDDFQKNIDIRIGYAIMSVINKLPSEQIRRILIDYDSFFSMMLDGDPEKVRFDIILMAREFQRVYEVLMSGDY